MLWQRSPVAPHDAEAMFADAIIEHLNRQQLGKGYVTTICEDKQDPPVLDTLVTLGRLPDMKELRVGTHICDCT